MERKLNGNCARMLWVVLNKSWRQHPNFQLIYTHYIYTLYTNTHTHTHTDIYIYIYIYIAPGVTVPPWATETVLSPWLAADEARISHVISHVVWWKKYIYINWGFVWWSWIGTVTALYHNYFTYHHHIVLLARISLILSRNSSYHLLLPVGPLDYIQCPYKAVVDRFLSVVQHLNDRVKRSIGEYRLWVRSCFSSSVRHVLSVIFVWF